MTKKKDSNNVEAVEKTFFGSRDDRPEDRSITSRDRVREQLNDEVEAFLSHGGNINHVKPHVTADPPKKPGSSYGSRPI